MRVRWFSCAAAVLLSGIAAATTGCKSYEEKYNLVPVAETPLEFDPTEQYVLAQWWTNGSQLLRLDDTAHYVLYSTTNRYGAVIERGRWSPHSYAAMWLEPYNERGAQRRRVRITKIDGELAVIVPDYEPMYALDQPPVVLEDRLLGQWEGPWGSLRLDGDLRYTLVFTTGDEATLSAVIRQHGSWRVADGYVLLHAQPGEVMTSLGIVEQDDAIILKAPTSSLTKQDKVAVTMDSGDH